jgi:hypothetical protein
MDLTSDIDIPSVRRRQFCFSVVVLLGCSFSWDLSFASTERNSDNWFSSIVILFSMDEMRFSRSVVAGLWANDGWEKKSVKTVKMEIVEKWMRIKMPPLFCFLC